MTSTAIAQLIASFALRSPGVSYLGCGLSDCGRYTILHWPRVWDSHKAFLAELLGLKASASWQAAKLIAEEALGAVTVSQVPEHALYAKELSVPASELSVIALPRDPRFIGRTPHPKNDATALARLPLPLRQLYCLVDGVGEGAPSSSSGLYVDPYTEHLVVNWALRLRRYPHGHPLTPANRVDDDARSLASFYDQSRACAPYLETRHSNAWRTVVGRSPWPDSAFLLVIRTPKLLDAFRTISVRLRAGMPHSTRLRLHPFAFTPEAVPNEFVVEGGWIRGQIDQLSRWFAEKQVPLVKLHLVHYRKRWFVKFPPGAFSGDFYQPRSHEAELATAESWIRDYEVALTAPSSGLEPLHSGDRRHVGPDLVYGLSYLRAFAYSAPPSVSIFFDAVATLVALGNQNPALLLDDDERSVRKKESRKLPSELLKRTPNWTPEEDDVLRQYFGVAANGTRRRLVESDWDNIFALLEPAHRSREQVYFRIRNYNARLRKSVLGDEGSWNDDARRSYEDARLGQNNRDAPR